MAEPVRYPVDIAAIRAALAAATPGPWYSGTALVAAENPDDNYWDETQVYALDADPATIALTDPTDGESNCRDKEAWCDAHEIGNVAATHNYYPIPDGQHDANNRLIANAPTWLAALCDEVDQLTTAQVSTAENLKGATTLDTATMTKPAITTGYIEAAVPLLLEPRGWFDKTGAFTKTRPRGAGSALAQQAVALPAGITLPAVHPTGNGGGTAMATGAKAAAKPRARRGGARAAGIRR